MDEKYGAQWVKQRFCHFFNCESITSLESVCKKRGIETKPVKINTKI